MYHKTERRKEPPPPAPEPIGVATTEVRTKLEIVEKKSTADNDIELNSENTGIKVKVNDSEPVFLYPKTDSKVESDGQKLVVSQQQKTEIDIRADEVERSKWQVGMGMNSDNHVKVMAIYEMGHSTSLFIQAGQGQKPVYGVLFSIGEHK